MSTIKQMALPRRHREMLALFHELGPNTHLSAAEVYERLRLRLPGVGLATVHRGLSRLAGVGELMRLDLPNSDAAVYEIAIGPHAHFVCNTCSTVTDLSYALPETEQSRLEAIVGGTITSSTISFHGVCQACS
jgi:Fur family peroxide stress response transcriptional regulator